MPSRPSLSIIDNRTAKLYEVPIAHNAVRATDFKQIKDPATSAEASTSGILISDPGLRNTAVVESKIAYMYDLHVAVIWELLYVLPRHTASFRLIQICLI